MLRYRFKLGTFIIFSLLIVTRAVPAQQADSSGSPAGSQTPAQSSPRLTASGSHKFWDKENVLLFTGATVARALDYSSTQHFRERGVNEVLLANAIVDNKPLFASIEAAGAAASVALSYWLHHTGHHRAERWVSIVHIGVAGFGDIRNYGLKKSQNTGAVY